LEQFGAKIQATAIEMPENISDDALVHHFIEGLPSRLRVQALLVYGNLDEVVSKTALVAKASDFHKCSPHSDPVFVVQEPVKETSDSTAAGPGTRNGGNESQGLRPYRYRVCYTCRELGNIARNGHKNNQNYGATRTSENGQGASAPVTP
jgi:hypothetical protein